MVKEEVKVVLIPPSISIKGEENAPPKGVENDRKEVLKKIFVVNVVVGKKIV